MENVWVLAALWVGLALIATLLAIWFRISTALTEIVVGTVVTVDLGQRRAGLLFLREQAPLSSLSLLAPNSIP